MAWRMMLLVLPLGSRCILPTLDQPRDNELSMYFRFREFPALLNLHFGSGNGDFVNFTRSSHCFGLLCTCWLVLVLWSARTMRWCILTSRYLCLWLKPHFQKCTRFLLVSCFYSLIRLSYDFVLLIVYIMRFSTTQRPLLWYWLCVVGSSPLRHWNY